LLGVARCLLTVVVAEQREGSRIGRREIKQDGAPSIWLTFHPPMSSPIWTAIDFLGARANNRACAFVIHHDTKQLHVGRLRHDRDRRRLGWRWRRVVELDAGR